MDHDTDEVKETAKKRAKVGIDGLTKHQRYYRRNAERLKKESANRQRQMREHMITYGQPASSAESSNGDLVPQSCPSRLDRGVQTDVLNTIESQSGSRGRSSLPDVQGNLEGLIYSYTKASLRHLYKDLGKLEDKTQRRLLELRQRVSSWSSATGGYLTWNETLELQIQAIPGQNREALEDLLTNLLVRKVTGQDLLCRLHELGVDDVPSCQHECIIAMRSRLHLMSVVSLGLGITDAWMLNINRRLRLLNTLQVEEALVVDQLLVDAVEAEW